MFLRDILALIQQETSTIVFHPIAPETAQIYSYFILY